MITTKYKKWFNRLFEPFGQILIRLRLTPNQITCAGLVLGMLSCAVFLMSRSLTLFFVLILAAGLLDALDGVVARLSGKTSKFGSYLDAVCDRVFEGCVAITVAIVTGHWILISLTLLGSLLISYAKARAAMEVAVSNIEWPDLMERTERGILFLVGFFISETTGIRLAGHDLFFWVLTVLAVAVYATVVQRILRARRIIEERC